MHPHPRYEIVGAIASGDFATVYRGRDRELDREVAIKQIHPHYLQDPRRLEGFWKEAQLLASLQHPNVMTIYDIVRDRGWLILEFMQGNLQQYAAGQPLDPEIIRTALVNTLDALAFLHRSGVTHGDVKPSNLLIDRLNRIKLGDFGLARRASNEQGSLLKGTTKYMAPEMLSPQFGQVGPAIDLYSLGFTAYDLACGKQFDDLFPGLDMFGPDRQVAWMMWHAAPDRMAPSIDRVLPHMPPDIANVIQRLIAKPQSQRYRTAEEALRDLSVTTLAMPTPKTDEEALAREKAARRKRWLAVGAFAFSAVLSLAVLFWPAHKPVAPPAVAPTVIQGVVRQVTPSRQMLILEVEDQGILKEIEVRLGDHHRVFLNDKASLLRDLQEQDLVAIHTLKDGHGNEIREVQAARAQEDQGEILEVALDEGRLTMSTADVQNSKPLLIDVPITTKIFINDRPGGAGRTFSLADLKVGERISVAHEPTELGRVANWIKLTRQVTSSGVLAKIDEKKREISWNPKRGDSLGTLEILPVDQKCEITLNDHRLVNNVVLGLRDLQPGDEVTVVYDKLVHRIDARRTFEDQGTIRNIAWQVRSLEVTVPGRPQAVTYIVQPDTPITLGGEAATIDDLRRGDQVRLVHDSPDGSDVQVREVAATRPEDRTRWAIIVSHQAFDDDTLPPVAYATSDRQLLRDVLRKRYAVPAEQVLLLNDESRIRLERALPEAITKAGAAAQLLIYFVGHGFADDAGQVYLAPRDFSKDRIPATGLPLKWFIDQLEASPAREKLLLFDACHLAPSEAPLPQPAAADMIETIRGTRSKPGLRTVTVIASTAKGERQQWREDRLASAFAFATAEAYSGQADKDRDLTVTPSEAFAYLQQALGSASSGPGLHPVQFLPNNTPPRLTDEARQAIRALAAVVRQTKVDTSEARLAFENAHSLSPKQPEATSLYLLALMKLRQWDEVQRRAQELKSAHPQVRVPYEASAWSYFSKFNYTAGVNELTELVGKLPKSPAGDKDALRILSFAGQLREYAETATEERAPKAEVVDALDAAVAGLGDEGQSAYTRGRQATRKITGDFDTKIAAATDRFDLSQLKFERRQLRHYAAFSFDAVAESVLAGLEE